MNIPRLPAEWEPQSGIMLTWPHAKNDWADLLGEVESVFINLAHQISLHELVLIVCFDHKHQQHIKQLLAQTQTVKKNLRFSIAPSNDVWARDHGPFTVSNEDSFTLLDFTFNGWDNKFPSSLDNQITLKLANQRAWDSHSVKPINFVLEGGAIESDGKGTLMLTASCLLTSNRNPNMDKENIEKQLSRYLGAEHFLWLNHGYLVGDDTDGHIDTLARFCDENTIAYVACDDPQDEHYAELLLMKVELKSFRDRRNEPFKLIPLPMPSAKYHEHVQRLPATYANFLILNGAVLVPTYDDRHDEQALSALQSCFPDRKIIGIDCSPMIHQFGSLHCVTMQLPAGVLQ